MRHSEVVGRGNRCEECGTRGHVEVNRLFSGRRLPKPRCMVCMTIAKLAALEYVGGGCIFCGSKKGTKHGLTCAMVDVLGYWGKDYGPGKRVHGGHKNRKARIPFEEDG